MYKVGDKYQSTAISKCIVTIKDISNPETVIGTCTCTDKEFRMWSRTFIHIYILVKSKTNKPHLPKFL